MRMKTAAEFYDIEGADNPVEYQKASRIFTLTDEQEGDAFVVSETERMAPGPIWIPESKRCFRHEHVFHPVSVFDVAAYIVKKTGKITTMKLQKLVYYCQAWSLVWDDAPLFSESIEAWANGPVVRELFAFHKGMYTLSAVPIGNPDNLSATQKETVDAVLDFYGSQSSQWLIDLTHLEAPWKAARAGMPDLERGNRIIPLDAVAEYYSSLPSMD